MQRLRDIVASVPDLNADSRVLDIGAGTGVLIPILQVSLCSFISSHDFRLIT